MPFSGIGLVNELLFVVRKVSVLRLFTDCCMMVTDYPRSFRGSFAMGAVVAFFWLAPSRRGSGFCGHGSVRGGGGL